MDILTIAFVVTFLFIHIYFCPCKPGQQEMNQRCKFKDFFFFQGNAFTHSPFHTWKRKKNLLLSVKFKTEGARVSLSDLLPCMFFYMGSIKGEFSPNFSSYIQEIVESFSCKFFILSSGITTHYGAKKEGM